MMVIVFLPLLTTGEKLREYTKNSEYIKCECDTRLSTNPEKMTVEFGGEPKTHCVYKSKDQHKPGDTDPYRIMENDKMYCEVLEGSCFTVKYYRQKANGVDANGVASGVDAECKSQGKFGTGWEANDGRILGGWPANSINDSCTIEAFTFKGCAVNETRKLIEYQRTQKKADEDIDLSELEDTQSMCQGEPKRNEQLWNERIVWARFNPPYPTSRENVFTDILDSIKNIIICNESMCNSKDYPYHGNTMAQWMVELEKRIANVTAEELKLKKASSNSLLILSPLLILSILL